MSGWGEEGEDGSRRERRNTLMNRPRRRYRRSTDTMAATVVARISGDRRREKRKSIGRQVRRARLQGLDDPVTESRAAVRPLMPRVRKAHSTMANSTQHLTTSLPPNYHCSLLLIIHPFTGRAFRITCTGLDFFSFSFFSNFKLEPKILEIAYICVSLRSNAVIMLFSTTMQKSKKLVVRMLLFHHFVHPRNSALIS